jgi:hypothetical protein
MSPEREVILWRLKKKSHKSEDKQEMESEKVKRLGINFYTNRGGLARATASILRSAAVHDRIFGYVYTHYTGKLTSEKTN